MAITEIPYKWTTLPPRYAGDNPLPDLTVEQLQSYFQQYINSGRSIPIKDAQDRQVNSKNWEKDIESFFVQLGYGFARNDSECPDFTSPLNFDIKSIRSDRGTKTFSIGGLTPEQYATGTLPYRIAILVWKYEDGRGRPVDAIIVPQDARTVLTNWSATGIQVKSGISASLLRTHGVMSARLLTPAEELRIDLLPDDDPSPSETQSFVRLFSPIAPIAHLYSLHPLLPAIARLLHVECCSM